MSGLARVGIGLTGDRVRERVRERVRDRARERLRVEEMKRKEEEGVGREWQGNATGGKVTRGKARQEDEGQRKERQGK